MLLNLSNHPSPTWNPKQRKAAIEQFGEIYDLAFPHIEPEWTLAEVKELAVDYCERIRQQKEKIDANNFCVHLMGELTFCLQLAMLLKAEAIRCLASTSRRMTKTLEDGTKNVQFDFVQFRNYF